MKDLKPQGPRILVRRSETLEKSAGGIILTTESQEPPKEGTILAIGTEKTLYKVGDKIIFASYAGTGIDTEDEALLIMQYTDVLAICN